MAALADVTHDLSCLKITPCMQQVPQNVSCKVTITIGEKRREYSKTGLTNIKVYLSHSRKALNALVEGEVS